MSTVSLTGSTRDCAPGLMDVGAERGAYHVEVAERFNAVLDIVDAWVSDEPDALPTLSVDAVGEVVAEQLVADLARASREAARALLDLGASEDDDDVITSSAYRIGPLEVESVLVEHLAVVEAPVLGKDDPERPEIALASAPWPRAGQVRLRSPESCRISSGAAPLPTDTPARSTSSTNCAGPSAAGSGAPNCAGSLRARQDNG